MPTTDPNPLFLERQTKLICSSYRHWLGKDLVSSDQNSLANLLLDAPFVVASSNADRDPILTYGNQMALDLWEMTWNEFTSTPGRYTAEPMERDQRESFLRTVKKNGFVDNYEGIRISKSGKRFKIHQATVWNLTTNGNDYLGQAATFSNWTYL